MGRRFVDAIWIRQRMDGKDLKRQAEQDRLARARAEQVRPLVCKTCARTLDAEGSCSCGAEA